MFFIVIGSVIVTVLSVITLSPIVTRWGLMDTPDDDRKAHSKEKPVAGVALGVGVLAGWTLAVALSLVPFSAGLIALGLGGLGMMALGVDDDRHPRPALWRLAGQFAIATLAVWFSQSVFHTIQWMGLGGELGGFALPLTVLWVVTLTNAFNLIDGSDGLAVGVVAVIAMGFASFATPPAAGLAAAMAGGTLGFWWFNKPHARAFLGDGGAYFLGFSLAMISLYASPPASATLEAPDAHAFPALGMAALFLFPMVDLSYAILRRVWSRRSIMSADHGHIHHRLQRHWGAWPMLAILYAFTALGVWAGGWEFGWWR